jgi:hypothetical protein
VVGSVGQRPRAERLKGPTVLVTFLVAQVGNNAVEGVTRLSEKGAWWDRLGLVRRLRRRAVKASRQGSGLTEHGGASTMSVTTGPGLLVVWDRSRSDQEGARGVKGRSTSLALNLRTGVRGTRALD